MKGSSRRSLRYKMTLYTALCVLIVGVLGNVYLYSYLNGIIVQKADSIDEMYLKTMKLQLDNNFEELYDIGQLCANHSDVSKAMKYTSLDSSEAKRACVQAQKVMNDLLSATSLGPNVYKLMLFNEEGLVVQASVTRMGATGDFEAVRASELYQNRQKLGNQPKFHLTQSITPYQGKCLALLLRIASLSSPAQDAYLYMEVNPALVSAVLMPYAKLNHVFALSSDALTIITNEHDAAQIASLSQPFCEGKTETTVNKVRYKLDRQSVTYTNLWVCSFADISQLSLGTKNMAFTLLVVTSISAAVAFGVSLIGSHYITMPLRRLTARIEKIAQNDFSFDPSIEQSQDEIGQVGKVVNEMLLSVDNLIKESVRSTDEKKNIEIAMLQAQVNPHFLYNTLDSVHWMAVLQKNQGIAAVTRSLSNLLRNMAKGVGDKITLRQELALLDDYVTIQSVRYAGVFEYANEVEERYLDYTIVKMTLQPLVENAIVHGVTAADRFGVVRVYAHTDANYLYITIEDNGVGMTPQEVKSALRCAEGERVSKGSMSGIGIANVHRRLQLIYGRDCGLSIESEKDRYTRLTVKIMCEKEEKDVSGADSGR